MIRASINTINSRWDKMNNMIMLDINNDIPFVPKKMHIIQDIKAGTTTKGIAYLKNHQFLLVLSGLVEINFHNGIEEVSFFLSAGKGYFINKMQWHCVKYITHNTMLAIFYPRSLEDDDKITNFNKFIQLSKQS
jgi:hypothetical protein